ncbi:putative oxidoreductase [Gordonia effusa NBRC 100432]|uniref:Putative oxidoreductase n=1 Tax=Gordonia effusa NBRC 100432 TaxID=1077974 RepID=H0R379_9ACTN|nr:SDR family oxidoreductase [Gordonia effusa]GAB19530.1 putative oxidoreductase [Gordonia effusa NBRC 100432]
MALRDFPRSLAPAARADARLQKVREALGGKVIAVTGGARGIGFETATQLLAAGAKVAIGDVDEEAVGKAAADLGVEGLHLDVTDPASFEKFLDGVEKAHGPVDVLINNAGIMPVGPFLQYSEALIRRTFDIDTLGVIFGAQAAGRRMSPRGTGQILNISSVAGRLPMPGLSIYNAAKAAVIELTEALDAELSPSGVRVSTVMPTFTNTGLITGLATNKFIATVEPKDVAAQVLWTIAKPKVRAAAPRSMAWVHANTLTPQPVKRAVRRMTKLDTIFLSYDEAARGEYSKRIGQ